MATVNALLKIIDGALLEGGGQILRVAISLSAILHTPIHVVNIRLGRSNPGLRSVFDCVMTQYMDGLFSSPTFHCSPQHVAGLQLVRDNTWTLGLFRSVTLMIQACLPCLVYMESTSLLLRGGTNVDFAPQFDYTLNFGAKMVESAAALLRHHFPTVPVHIDCARGPTTVDSATGLVLWATTSTGCVLGSDILSTKSVVAAADVLGREAASKLVTVIESGSCVDSHLQDQLIIFAFLAKGTSRIRCSYPMTLHSETAICICQLLTNAKIDKELQDDGSVIVSIEGIGHQS